MRLRKRRGLLNKKSRLAFETPSKVASLSNAGAGKTECGFRKSLRDLLSPCGSLDCLGSDVFTVYGARHLH
jgi:hypothetical protein